MKRFLSILLSAILIVCVAFSAAASEDVLTIADVAIIDNYVTGTWNASTGEFQENQKRIVTNGFVDVDASKTYTIAGMGHGGLSFYLAEYDDDKNFVKGRDRVQIGGGLTYSYTPSANVSYVVISISIYTGGADAVDAEGSNGLFARWVKSSNRIGITMVVEGGEVQVPVT